jgi:transposase
MQIRASGDRGVIQMDVWHAIQVLKRLGKGKKTIARELKISKTTVKRYWDRNIPPAYIRGPQEKMLDPYASQIQAMIGQKFIGTRIFHELGQMGYTGSITSVYRYLQHCRGHKGQAEKTTIHFETRPGQQMQYDWTEWLLPVRGLPVKVYFHQAILSFSRYKFVTFSLDITTETIIRVLHQALVAFGGVPEEIVIDNPRQMVISHSPQGTICYQDDFLAFLGVYALKPDPCRPYRARTKGKVENPFYYLKEHFLRGLEVADLGELDDRLTQFMEHYNQRSHRTTGQPPVVRWRQEQLAALPQAAPLAYKLEPRLVSWDGYVHVEGNRYPVPLAFAGQDLWVERVMGRWLQVKDAGLKPVARYDLLRDKGVTLPHPEHEEMGKAYLAKKAARRAQAQQNFLKTFPESGPAFVHLAEQRYQANAGYHLHQILALLAVYDHSAVAAALNEALSLGTPAVVSVKALLPEDLKDPVFPLFPARPMVPAVLKRPLAVYGASQVRGAA